MPRFALYIVGLLSLLIFACQHMETGEENRSLLAEVVYNSHQCGRSDKGPAAEWIKDNNHLFLVYLRLRRDIIGSVTRKPPKIDFTKDGVLLIEMGQRPTTGYGLSFTANNVFVNSGRASVKVNWIEPEQDSILAQVLTSPCIMIKLPAAGYSLVRVLDQHGEIRTEVNIMNR